MRVVKEELERAWQMATAEHWEDGLPTVTANLRLAVNSLHAQCHGAFPSARILIDLINKKNNVGVRKILSDKRITTEALARAIRDALS